MHRVLSLLHVSALRASRRSRFHRRPAWSAASPSCEKARPNSTLSSTECRKARDLHNHLSGAIYAEGLPQKPPPKSTTASTRSRWPALARPASRGRWMPPSTQTDNNLRNAMIDSLSMRDFRPRQAVRARSFLRHLRQVWRRGQRRTDRGSGAASRRSERILSGTDGAFRRRPDVSDLGESRRS